MQRVSFAVVLLAILLGALVTTIGVTQTPPPPGGSVTLQVVDTFPPPDCCSGVLMFSGGNQIRFADLDRGLLVRAFDAAYTPERHWRFIMPRQRPGHPSQIAFIGRPSDASRAANSLYVLDLVTRMFSQVPGAPPREGAYVFSRVLQWSPDGRQLAYKTARTLFAEYPADAMTVITVDAPTRTWSVKLLDAPFPYAFADPLWNPRTGQIVGVYRSEAVAETDVLGFLEADCWLQFYCEMLIDDTSAGAFLVQLLDWHPSQQRIMAYGLLPNQVPNRGWNLLEINLNEQNVRQVNTTTSADEQIDVLGAAYSPHGDVIAYSADPDGIVGIGDDRVTNIAHPQEVIFVDADTYAHIATIPVAMSGR